MTKTNAGREPVTDSNVNGTEADDERLRAPQCDDHERGHEAQDAPSPPTTIRTSVRIRGKKGHRRERRRRTLAQASARRTRVHCGFGAEKQARMLRRPPRRRRTRDSFGEAHPRTLWRRTKDATALARHTRARFGGARKMRQLRRRIRDYPNGGAHSDRPQSGSVPPAAKGGALGTPFRRVTTQETPENDKKCPLFGDLRKVPHSFVFPMALHDSASTIAYAIF